ncbi:dimethylarginine dimethylaminohydrolase family protein [Bacillus sp. CLL-7-23]|uniref:Dimethylarginine dimethylaminohydrolase family protein n=1 Tax=Bacillus changyiensis TaxID=3004103 RepID=A0ABT4X1L4_9BACI|nr:dimethylarginine dimethylaminohydrolase family protein [Bacillus changyiensis]MDA7026177.1 dimethylarginine dimethylaminohydrolase family protein [Bacillus changyiensis]
MNSVTVKKNDRAGCNSEYDRLKIVALCRPEYMEIAEVINETQKYFYHDNINKTLAVKQHETLIKELKNQGVEVVLLPSESQFPEQVFTRDIGFVIGETIFTAQLSARVRQGEENVLQRWLEKENLSYQPFNKGYCIEGGDILIDQNTVYAGISSRTTFSAVQQLKRQLTSYEVIPVPFEESFLHLDCIFNILSEDEALIYPKALGENEYKRLKERYNLIEITDDEQFTLGTNILSLGNQTVISLPHNKQLNKQLQKRGYTVIEIDLSEIIKSGGSFRCCTMPLQRSCK